MDSDLDPFGDLLAEPAVNHARIGGKFQPRAKPPPRKVTSTSLPCVLPSNAKEKPVPSLQPPLDTAESVHSVNIVGDRLTSQADLFLASSALLGNKEQVGNNGENTKHKLVNSSIQLVTRNALPSEVVVFNENNNGASSLVITKADTLRPDLDSFAGVVSDTFVSKDNRSEEPLSSSLTTVAATIEPGEDNDGLLLHKKTSLEEVNLLPARIKDVDPVDATDSEAAAVDDSGGWSSSFVKSTDVGSLGLELELIADTVARPAIGNARAGGKFKPRGMAQSRKGVSEAIAVAISTMKEPASLASTVSANLQSAEFVDVGGGGLADPVNSSITTLENLISREPSKNEDCINSGVILSNDPHTGLGKPIGENADIFSGLEYIHDFVTRSPGSIEIPTPASNDETEPRCGFPAQNSANSSALRACNTAVLDPVTCNESVVQANEGRLESEESGRFPNMERPEFLSESTIASGSVAPPTDIQFAPSETVYDNEDSVAAFPSDEVVDYSRMCFSNFISPDTTTSEFSVNEQQINLTEAPQPGDASVSHQEDASGVPAKESSKSKKRKSSSLSNPSQKSKESSLVGGRNEGDKSSWNLRKRTAGLQHVDEPEDEPHDNDGFPSEAPTTSIADDEDYYYYREEDDNDNEDRVEITSQKPRASKNSNKPDGEKDNRARRCKRDDDPQEHSNQVPHKKFSHSTRRKSRLKNLLSMPEEEIDFQRLPLKDIILLAGYKEHLAVKEAKTSKNASNNQSTTNSTHGEESHNEEDNVASKQDKGYVEDQSNSLFNCHSFMDRTPTARWSKQDTELFYEGIRQFGTDLSMIQQLFPGKTRHQMKLKYKKEERQHPLKLFEALSSRAKDHSYFEKVIEQLQPVATQAEQESNRDDSMGVTDEEAELNPETNEEIAKSERHEGVAFEDHEGDIGGVHSTKYDEDEDDMDIWSSYQSVF